MVVRESKECLEGLNPELPVFVTSGDVGDGVLAETCCPVTIWGTAQALIHGHDCKLFAHEEYGDDELGDGLDAERG